MRLMAAIWVYALSIFASTASALTVHPGAWGEVSVPEIELLLRDVQRNFYSAFSHPPTNDLHIWQGDPQIALRQSSRESIQIFLDVQGRHWAQFAYQFAHELGHVACDYGRFHSENGAPHPSMWFQEALCETASLFTLRRMAVNWKKKPPRPNARNYAEHLHAYAQELIDDPRRQLPAGMRLADWYATNRLVLAANSTDRSLNGVVANRLLILFEAQPQGWQAVRYLPVARGTLTGFFQAWRAQTPRKFAPIIRSIAREFDVTLSGDSREQCPQKNVLRRSGDQDIFCPSTGWKSADHRRKTGFQTVCTQ